VDAEVAGLVLGSALMAWAVAHRRHLAEWASLGGITAGFWGLVWLGWL
jgi:hypothetical protein